jgi:hypothetical protein
MPELIKKLTELSLQDTYTRAQMKAAGEGVFPTEETLNDFKEILEFIIKNDDERLALIARYVLEDVILLKLDPKLKNSELTGPFRKIVSLLKIVNLGARGIAEISNLLEDYFLSGMQAGIGMKDKLQQVLNYYDDFTEEGKIAEQLTAAIFNNREKLGKVPFVNPDKTTIEPTIGNWLKDFLQFSIKSSEGYTSSLQRVKYFETTPNVKSLTQEEQKLLAEIFRIYNWLRFGDSESQFRETEEMEEDNKNASQTKPAPQAAPNRVSPPPLPPPPRPTPPVPASPRAVAPRAPSVPPSAPKAEIKLPQTAPFPSKSLPAQPVKPKQSVQQRSSSPTEGVNIQDMLYQNSNSASQGRGLKMEGDAQASKFQARPSAPAQVQRPATSSSPDGQFRPREAKTDIVDINREAIFSKAPGGMPVLQPKNKDEAAGVKDKVDYTAKESEQDDIDEKIARLKQKIQKK